MFYLHTYLFSDGNGYLDVEEVKAWIVPPDFDHRNMLIIKNSVKNIHIIKILCRLGVECLTEQTVQIMIIKRILTTKFSRLS